MIHMLMLVPDGAKKELISAHAMALFHILDDTSAASSRCDHANHRDDMHVQTELAVTIQGRSNRSISN